MCGAGGGTRKPVPFRSYLGLSVMSGRSAMADLPLAKRTKLGDLLVNLVPQCLQAVVHSTSRRALSAELHKYAEATVGVMLGRKVSQVDLF